MSLKQALISQVIEAWGMTEAEATKHVNCAIENILAQIWMLKKYRRYQSLIAGYH